MSREKKILILTDGKAGHENQSKAFARQLGAAFDIVEVHFVSKFAKARSYLLDHLGAGDLRLLTVKRPTGETVALESAQDVFDGNYCAVVGTGSGTFYAAKSLAKALDVACGVVLYPRGYRLADFNCILAPSFDRPAKIGNVVEIPANLVANDEAFYERGMRDFEEHYRKANSRALDGSRDAVAVIVGGPNKCSTLSPAWMKRKLDEIFATHDKSLIWVTTSRRTPSQVDDVIRKYPFDYRLLYSEDHFNPIPAFVKMARTLYVTAESTGMLSEACTFGSAEVIALDNLKAGRHKFRRFVEAMTKDGYLNGSRKIDLTAQFSRAKRLMGV